MLVLVGGGLELVRAGRVCPLVRSVEDAGLVVAGSAGAEDRRVEVSGFAAGGAGARLVAVGSALSELLDSDSAGPAGFFTGRLRAPISDKTTGKYTNTYDADGLTEAVVL